jgi:predicted short-subunit dehydrogenase-like oxidoreductase (DUF2520 family)
VIGAGRVGTALARALRAAGYAVDGPAGRGQVPAGEAVILCVPDHAIAGCARIAASRGATLVGHTSGATPLSALAPAADAGAELFGLHPLQSFSAPSTSLAGSGAAIGGSTERALSFARELALDLGMEPFPIDERRRGAYHAAASIASNFLVTLEDVAEEVAAGAGLERSEARRLLGPLVRTTVERWAAVGPDGALTGPVARGDAETVAAQRGAVEEVDPELLALFDALVERTEALAARGARADFVGAPA